MIAVVVILAAVALVGGYLGIAVHAARTEIREKGEALESARGRDVLVGFPDGERRVRIIGLSDDGGSVRVQEGRSETVVPLTDVRSIRRHAKEPQKRW